MTEVSPTETAASALDGRRLMRSAGWMVGSHLVAQTFAYGSLILLARWLSPSSFGTLAVGTAVVYVSLLFVDQGAFGGIMVRRQLTRADLVGAFRRCLSTSIVLAAVIACSAGLLVGHFASGGDAAAVAALALCLPLHAIAVVPTALLQKSMQFRRLSWLTAAVNVASAAVAVFMASEGVGVWSLVARQLLVFVALAIWTPVLCLRALREHRQQALQSSPSEHTPGAERWFFLFGVALMTTANLDSLVVGASGDAQLLGLYALAFTIAMTPSTDVSEQLGKVLFAASALAPESSRERTVQSVTLMSILFLPLVPVGVLVAPTVLPAVLGEQWRPMVVVFQLLLVVGVGQAIVNCIGEALSGNGHIEFRAKAMMAKCVFTLAALAALVSIDGIRGAAFAQLLVFVPYTALYLTTGARRAGTSSAELWHRLRPVAAAVAVQLAVSGCVLAALSTVCPSRSVAACAAAVLGLGVGAPLLVWLVRQEGRS